MRRLEGLVGVSVDAGELEDGGGDYERQVSLAVQSDPDVQAFVERLERAAAEEEGPQTPPELPSGDVIAREFQRFLSQRGTRLAESLTLGRRAGDPVVAHRARRVRGRRLEALGEDPVGDARTPCR